MHVEDVAGAVLASMDQSLCIFAADAGAPDASEGGAMAAVDIAGDGCPVEGAGCSTYLLADNEPAAPADVLRYTAELYGLPTPEPVPYEGVEAELSAEARVFWSRPVRASAANAYASLGVQLAYPTYREGLRAVKAAEGISIESPPAPPPSEAPPAAAKPKAPKKQTAKQPAAPLDDDQIAEMRRQVTARGFDDEKDWTVMDLKFYLKAFKLKVGGKKRELIERLSEYMGSTAPPDGGDGQVPF